MLKKDEDKGPIPVMTLAQALATMIQLVAGAATQFFRMGQLYNAVVSLKLAENAGHKNALEYFCQNIQELSRSALSMYGAVAHSFSEPVCTQLGVTRLYLLLTYKEAADIQVNHDEPGGTFIEVPGENGAATPKPFSACSVEDLRKAILRKRKPSSSKPLPAEDLALVNQFRESVTGRFPKGSPVRVEVRNHKGEAVVDFKGVPVSQVDKLTEALLEQLYPVREVPEVEQAPTVA